MNRTGSGSYEERRCLRYRTIQLYVAQTQRQATYYGEEQGSGMLFFAGTMLGLAGIMRIIDSIWAFSYKGALPDGLKDGTLGSDLKNYAWLWLAVGIILLVSSGFVLVRSQFARWVGLFAAAIAGISAITWMPYYPIWSLTYIAIAVTVLYRAGPIRRSRSGLAHTAPRRAPVTGPGFPGAVPRSLVRHRRC